MQEEVYKYGRDFQMRILAMIARDAGFVRQYRGVLSADYFEYPLMKIIARLCLETFDTYGVLPSKETMGAMLSKTCKDNRMDEQVTHSLYTLAAGLYTFDLSDSKAAAEQVVMFGKVQAIRGSLIEVVRILDQGGEIEQAERILRRASSLGQTTDAGLGIDLFANMVDLPYLMSLDRNNGWQNRIKMPHFPTLERSTNGGVGRGHVYGIMGYPGDGKSTLMRMMAYDALMQGIPVVHYTLADLRELDVLAAYTSLLTGVPLSDVINNTPVFRERATVLMNYRGFLKVKEFSPRAVTVSAIASHLTEILAVDRVKPGVIIVDYPDMFKESKPKEDRWTNEANNIIELCAIAKEFGCVVWWAWHVTKDAGREKSRGKSGTDSDMSVLTMADGKGSFEKAQPVDGVISLNRNENERRVNAGRLHVDKLRYGDPPAYPIPVNTNYACSLIQEVARR
jgi:KaiC/GvpD/RAD55 family RecA-like ATPase